MNGPLERARGALAAFALSPASTRPLVVLRVGVAGVLLAEALSTLPALPDLSAARSPNEAWARLATSVGVEESHVALAAAALYVVALGVMASGKRARVAAGVAWALHAALLGRAPGERHGADDLAQMALFYAMVAPTAPRAGGAAEGARLALRVLQIHLAVMQGASGVEKATSDAWRHGEAVWRALMLPEYQRFDFSFLAAHPWVAGLAGWSVALVEVACPLLVWSRRTRAAAVAATSILHLAIAATMGLTAFSALMIVLTIAAFAVPSEPDPPSIGGAPRPPPI